MNTCTTPTQICQPFREYPTNLGEYAHQRLTPHICDHGQCQRRITRLGDLLHILSSCLLWCRSERLEGCPFISLV